MRHESNTGLNHQGTKEYKMRGENQFSAFLVSSCLSGKSKTGLNHQGTKARRLRPSPGHTPVLARGPLGDRSLPVVPAAPARREALP